MIRSRRAVVALTAVLGLFVAGTLFAQEPPAPQAATPGKARFVTPYRGTAEVEFTAPKTVVDHKTNQVTTTIQVKNITKGNIIRLTVEEFWWDKAGSPVTGGKDWCRKPLASGEVYTFTIVTQRDPKMFRNNYKFSHANGDVKPKSVKKLSE